MWQGLWVVPGSPSGVGASLGPLGPAAVRPRPSGPGVPLRPDSGDSGCGAGVVRARPCWPSPWCSSEECSPEECSRVSSRVLSHEVSVSKRGSV